MSELTIQHGDCRDLLPWVADGLVDCCVTSPPYWGLRDYGVAGQIGQEATPEEFVETMVRVFREVRRVLKPEGTLWLNLGDSYAGSGLPGLKPKDLVGIPWRVALALQADGWWLRQDIIWHKPNPMPESVTDRCTKAHEYVFLLSKGERYYFDQEAIKEKSSEGTHPRRAMKTPDGWDTSRGEGGHGVFHKNGREKGKTSWKGSEFHTGKTGGHQQGRAQGERKFDPGAGNKNNASFDAALAVMPESRNKRSVWTVATKPYKEAHFATYPPDLVKPCILAGCPAGGLVLDPFGGSGTTGEVALELGRRALLMELSGEYLKLIHRRCAGVTPGLGF